MDRIQFKDLRMRLQALTIPELIRLLSSEELKTRFAAEMALRDATST